MPFAALDFLSSVPLSSSLLGGVGELAAAGTASLFPDFGWFSRAVETTTGWFGLAIVFVYSFLIAFALPGVSEVVLFAPLELGLSNDERLALVVVVSGVGKAAGSVFAFHLGQEAKNSGFVERRLRNSRFDVVEWTEKKTLQIAQTWGYAGLAGALCVPGFPDTLSIYAFSVLEEDYVKFALATFVGSVGRLLLTAATLKGTGLML